MEKATQVSSAQLQALHHRFPELLMGSHPILQRMVTNGDSLTRDHYLSRLWPVEPPPDPYPAEHEAMLPRVFRLSTDFPAE